MKNIQYKQNIYNANENYTKEIKLYNTNENYKIRIKIIQYK